MIILSWREAHEALTESGHDVNSAQCILDDLANFPEKSFSYRTSDEVRWLAFAGTNDDYPVYASGEEAWKGKRIP
jgi:hypothetical protein